MTRVALALLAVVARAQEPREQILDVYRTTLASLRTMASEADVRRAVNAMDVPEWVGVSPGGRTINREEAVAQLKGLLTVPPERRPEIRQEVIHVGESAWAVEVAYWVFVEGANGDLTGTIARDTWSRTPAGWRRVRHEKIFPERRLVRTGKGIGLAASEGR